MLLLFVVVAVIAVAEVRVKVRCIIFDQCIILACGSTIYRQTFRLETCISVEIEAYPKAGTNFVVPLNDLVSGHRSVDASK